MLTPPLLYLLSLPFLPLFLSPPSLVGSLTSFTPCMHELAKEESKRKEEREAKRIRGDGKPLNNQAMKNVGPFVAIVIDCFMDHCVYGFTVKVFFHMTPKVHERRHTCRYSWPCMHAHISREQLLPTTRIKTNVHFVRLHNLPFHWVFSRPSLFVPFFLLQDLRLAYGKNNMNGCIGARMHEMKRGTLFLFRNIVFHGVPPPSNT